MGELETIKQLIIVFLLVMCSGCLEANEQVSKEQTINEPVLVDVPIVPEQPAYTITCNVIDIAGRGDATNIQAAGEVIKYSVIIKNTGNESLTGISLYDGWNGVQVPEEFITSEGVLTTGKQYVYQGEYTVQEIDMISYNEQKGVLVNAIRVTTNEAKSERTELRVPITYELRYYGSNQETEFESGVYKDTLWLNSNTYSVGGDGHTIQITHNSNAIDPTYSEMLSFLRNDKTDMHRYIPNQYVCADYAEELQSNAAYEGWNCAYVTVTFNDGTKHACNAFNTVDQGLVFIDCTGTQEGSGPSVRDCTVILEQGQEYKPEYVVKTDWETETMGVVRSYGVHWG